MQMPRTTKRLLLAVGLLSAVALAVTACGGDDKDKPFSLGGDSQVVGFTPTPTARFPEGPKATATPDGHGTPAPTSGPTTPPPTGGGNGNVTAGRQVFTGSGCTGCHAIQGISTGSVGPNLTRIGTVAETRVAGKTAEQYIKESIENPGAFIAPGFPNAMPGGLASGTNLDNLVAFLLAQK
jgi:cytochrome c2